MQLSADLRYSAPPAAVAAMLADPDFVNAKCERMHSQRHEVDVQGNPLRVFTVTTTRTMSTDRVPEFARPLVGRHLLVRQVDRWLRPDSDGNRDGYLTLSITGLPLTFDGRYELRAVDAAPGAGPTTRQTVSGQLRAAVPLVGPQIEKLAEQAIRAAIGLEQRLGAAWLATHQPG